MNNKYLIIYNLMGILKPELDAKAISCEFDKFVDFFFNSLKDNGDTLDFSIKIGLLNILNDYHYDINNYQKIKHMFYVVH